jgi:tripartite-type tricarboxylate transporter receptor subunit TctC
MRSSGRMLKLAPMTPTLSPKRAEDARKRADVGERERTEIAANIADRCEMKLAAFKSIAAVCLTIGVSCSMYGRVSAQTPSEFYKNKQIRMIIGHSAGNDYDLAGRFLARYLAKHIPGEPTIIVQNMPAAASIAAANYLYAQAPRDGTVLGSFSRNVPSQARMGQANLEADPRRFNWLGATSLPARVCVRWVTAPVKTPADLFTQEFIVGGAGAGSSLSILPTVFNHVLGTKFRLILGYKGTTDTVLAMERGELQGACASYGQFRVYENLIRDGKLTFLLRAEESPIPEIPEVPSIFDFAKTTEQRQLMRFIFSSTEFGRPYVFPPDVPRERVETMRKAFAETLQDPALLAEATRMKMDMSYRPPDDLERLVAGLYETPPDLIETVKKLVPNLQ